MSLVTNLQALATQTGVLIKELRTYIYGTGGSDLSGLTTTDKSSLVAAINEAVTSGGAAIDDAAPSLTTTYSGTKIDADVAAATAALVGGAPGALDTLNELAAAMADDAAFSATMTNSLALKANISDTFTRAQLGLDAETHDFVADLNAAL